MTFMSDFNGKPIFYSNGCTIQNASHELMQNGDSLLLNDYRCGNGSAMNFAHGGGVTLPSFSDQQYTIFSLSQDLPLSPQPCTSNRLVAHSIDMVANQGKGKVTQKGQLLLSGCFQEPSANRHANGRDWWILVGDNQQAKFYRWLYTPSGLQGPWEQVIPNPTVDGYWYCGWSEFSSDGERYLVNSCRTGTAVYDFDRCTGLLSNQIFLQLSTAYNEPATFSPDSKLLYTVDNFLKELVQYDLTATNINASRKVLSVWDGTVDSFNIPSIFQIMQQGPDGKIYIWGGGSSYMHLINFPNRMGVDADVRQRAIKLPSVNFGPSLYYPRFRLGPIDESSCDTLGIDNLPSALFRYDIEDTLSPLEVTFTDVSSYLPTAWHWNFGDGAMSQDTNPIHAYALPGTYNVCLIVSNAFAADTFCRQVTVGTTGIHELPALPHAAVNPNPFSSELRVQLPVLVGVSPHFVLYDLFGREIKSAWLRDFDTYLPLSQLPAGMYVWQLRWNGVVTQSGRVVKQ
ncbi:MAG: PKD domain-containing protein [Saprospiraceae bacterium]